MTQYIWFPTKDGSINIDLPEEQDAIYDDMMRFAVASVWGNKQTQIGKKPLGDVIKLDSIIESFSEKEGNWKVNTKEAKKVFGEILDLLKKTSLKEALKEMEYQEDLGTYADITLNEKGAGLSAFKMQPASEGTEKEKIMTQKYEQSLKEFKKPALKRNAFKIANFNVELEGKAQVVNFDFELDYKEVPEDNEEELDELEFGHYDWENIMYEDKITYIPWSVEDKIQLNVFEVINKATKTGKLSRKGRNELRDEIIEKIYNNFKTKNKLKEAILSPRYVTSFKINGTYNAKTLTSGGKKPTETIRLPSVRNQEIKEKITKRTFLSYSGEGETTHELNVSETLIPRAFTTTPTHTNQPSTPRGQASRNIIITERVDLIEEIQGNLRELGRAIGSLT